VALALMLLIGAGLLVRSFIKLQQVAPGFDSENVLTMTVAAAGTSYGKPTQRDPVFSAIGRSGIGLTRCYLSQPD